MSEPQTTSVEELMKPTVTPSTEEPITASITEDPIDSTEQNTEQQTPLTGNVKTLKDAFPNVDVEVIEAILQSQGGQLEAAFDALLSMSDPTYKAEPREAAQESQVEQDEAYARRLADEADAKYARHSTNNDDQQFNLQEKVIEVGTAAKNKIMDLYNQFMAGPSDQQQQPRNTLEAGMGNLSLSEDKPLPPQIQQTRNESVDLYEWDGKDETSGADKTSTPAEQLLSDEEFARQLAREDAETATNAAEVHDNETEAESNREEASEDKKVSVTDNNDADDSNVVLPDEQDSEGGLKIEEDLKK